MSNGDDAASPLLRRELAEALARREVADALAVTSRLGWAVLGVLGFAVVAALVVVCVGRVDVTARARGVLRAPQGIQTVVIGVDGVIAEVSVEEGEVVEAGALLARLDSTELRAALDQAEQQLAELTEESFRDDEDAKVALAEIDRHVAHQRQAVAAERAAVRTRVGLLERRRDRWTQAEAAGAISTDELEEVALALADERRRLFALDRGVAELEADLASERRAVAREASAWRQKLAVARAAVDAARIRLEATRITASSSGKIDAIAASPGTRVRHGDRFATLHPGAGSKTGIAFVPEHDRGFLTVGAAARLELDQYPVGEFSAIDAQVVRISGDLASADELAAVFGAEAATVGPHVRVELAVVGGDPDVVDQLASGALFSVRVRLRERRLIGLLFDPIRRWLDE